MSGNHGDARGQGRKGSGQMGTTYQTREQAQFFADKKAAKGGRQHEPYFARGWRVRVAKPAKQPRPVADTGPDRKTRAVVLERDGYACARCGRPCGPRIGQYSLQHRVARGVGGDSRLSNLVLLCGSAVTGCHGEVEARKYPDDQDKGYRLESWQDPLLEGVMYFERDGSGLTRWLEDDGGLLDEPPVEAVANG